MTSPRGKNLGLLSPKEFIQDIIADKMIKRKIVDSKAKGLYISEKSKGKHAGIMIENVSPNRYEI